MDRETWIVFDETEYDSQEDFLDSVKTGWEIERDALCENWAEYMESYGNNEGFTHNGGRTDFGEEIDEISAKYEWLKNLKFEELTKEDLDTLLEFQKKQFWSMKRAYDYDNETETIFWDYQGGYINPETGKSRFTGKRITIIDLTRMVI